VTQSAMSSQPDHDPCGNAAVECSHMMACDDTGL